MVLNGSTVAFGSPQVGHSRGSSCTRQQRVVYAVDRNGVAHMSVAHELSTTLARHADSLTRTFLLAPDLHLYDHIAENATSVNWCSARSREAGFHRHDARKSGNVQTMKMLGQSLPCLIVDSYDARRDAGQNVHRHLGTDQRQDRMRNIGATSWLIVADISRVRDPQHRQNPSGQRQIQYQLCRVCNLNARNCSCSGSGALPEAYNTTARRDTSVVVGYRPHYTGRYNYVCNLCAS